MTKNKSNATKKANIVDKKIEKFKIIVEVLVPTNFIYNVEAENEQEAIKKINRLPDIIEKPNFGKRKLLQAKVKKQGSNNIILTKKL